MSLWIKKETLSFGTITAQDTEDLTIDVPGALTGDVVAVGLADNLIEGLLVTAFVADDDVVTVRVANITGGNAGPLESEFTVSGDR